MRDKIIKRIKKNTSRILKRSADVNKYGVFILCNTLILVVLSLITIRRIIIRMNKQNEQKKK